MTIRRVSRTRRGTVLPRENSNLGELIKLANNKQFIALSKHDRLFVENEKVKGVYFLLSGKIKMVKSNSEKTDSTIYLIEAPDIICLHSVLDEECHFHTAIAEEDSMVCLVPRIEFERILEKNMQIAFNIMKMLCLKIKVVEEQIHRYV